MFFQEKFNHPCKSARYKIAFSELFLVFKCYTGLQSKIAARIYSDFDGLVFFINFAL